MYTSAVFSNRPTKYWPRANKHRPLYISKVWTRGRGPGAEVPPVEALQWCLYGRSRDPWWETGEVWWCPLPHALSRLLTHLPLPNVLPIRGGVVSS